ncbi:hypothetical protein MMC25_001669 [Agyrium rufum]|nr:hypothetical protein [Agyrium rufum]
MPVTIIPVPHAAEAVKLYGKQPQGDVSRGLLLGCLGPEQRQLDGFLEAGFSNHPFSAVYQSCNGFVQGAIHAYSHHHHLVIRPEDVWFAILTQLSLYINKHAEELRGKLVAHKGQKKLVLVAEALFSEFIWMMGNAIQENIRDQDLREWIMPSFSTTTDNDRVVASAIMMATMQRYFTYEFDPITCGLPSVCLLGEKTDWQLIEDRLEKLATFGEEPTRWMKLLRPVLKRMVQGFDEPTAPDTLFFWNRIAHVTAMGSGTDYYSGWISAFCFWDDDGQCLDHKSYRYPGGKSLTELTVASKWNDSDSFLALDDVLYHRVDVNNVPSGYSTVPVDIRPEAGEYVFEASLLAGSMGLQAWYSCPTAGTVPAVGGSSTVKQHAPKSTKTNQRPSSVMSALKRLCCLQDNSSIDGMTLPARLRRSHGGEQMSTSSVPGEKVHGRQLKLTVLPEMTLAAAQPHPETSSMPSQDNKIRLPVSTWDESTINGTQSIVSDPTERGYANTEVDDTMDTMDDHKTNTIGTVTGWVLYKKVKSKT